MSLFVVCIFPGNALVPGLSIGFGNCCGELLSWRIC